MFKALLPFFLLILTISVFAGGEFDTTFSGDGISVNHINLGVETTRAVLIQPDGKILLIGNITEDNQFGTARDLFVRRVLVTGDTDTTFGNQGVAFLKIGPGDDFATGAALQSDGKIVIVGGFANPSQTDSFIARINPNGTFDTTFDGDGIVKPSISLLDDSANAVAIQADRRIVVAGYRGTGTAADSMVLRLNSNGSFDSAFGSLGRVFLSVGTSSESFRAVSVQTDGKIVAAGEASSGSRPDFAVARFNANGSTDATFGTGGRVTTSVAAGSNIGKALKLQTDGKIVVAGAAAGDFGVVRYLTNGFLDSAFGGDGKETVDFSGGNDSAETLQILPDGKIFVGGTRLISGAKRRGAVMFETNGAISFPFFGSGLDQPAPDAFSDNEMTASALSSNGHVIAAVSSITAGKSRLTYREYDVAGFVFGVSLPAAAIAAALSSVALPDGKILVGGYFDYWKNSKYTLMRLNADGSPDTTFGTEGRVVGCAGQANCGIYDLKRQADGKIVAAAKINGNGAVLRFNANGTLDATFGLGGVAAFNIFASAKAVEIDSAGRILVIVGRSNNFNLAVYRLTSFGTLDASFTVTGLSSILLSADALALQPDGKIIVAGTQYNASGAMTFKMIRLTTTGLVDSTFGTNGETVTQFSPGGLSFATAAVVQSDGSIILGGAAVIEPSVDSIFGLARYNPAGQLDLSFGNNGLVTAQVPKGGITSLALQPDGRIVAVGRSQRPVTKGWPFAVARYLPAGAADQSFGTGGVLFAEVGQGQGEASDVLIDGTGRIVVTGHSSNYPALMRLLP